MTKTIEAYLALVGRYCEALQKDGLPIELCENKRKNFIDSFKIAYETYKSDYLTVDVEYLDRHKTAALFVTVGLETGIISSSQFDDKLQSGNIFIGVEKILILSAIDYMLAMYNKTISKANENSDYNLTKMTQFSFPKAFACSTEYVDIMSRTLYYSFREKKLNKLELSEKFFLLEYISILQTFGDESENYFDSLRNPLNANSDC